MLAPEKGAMYWSEAASDAVEATMIVYFKASCASRAATTRAIFAFYCPTPT